MASTSLSTLLKAHLGLGMVSSTPFWVVPSQESHGVLHLLGHGPERQRHARRDAADDHLDLLLEDELAVALDGVLGVRLLLDDSWTWRPRMPPALFTRSAHHAVPRSPAVPTGAAMPARIASMPIFTGSEGTPFLAWARATAGKPTAPRPPRRPPPSGIHAWSWPCASSLVSLRR